MEAGKSPYTRIPLSVRILIGVALGIGVGLWLGKTGFAIGGTTLQAKPLGDISMLVIKLLKTLATPLILFAVLDAFVRTHMPARQGARLVGISAVNACVAITIGLGIANVFHPGDSWHGHIDDISQKVAVTDKKEGPKATLDLVENVSSYVPKNIVEPFADNSIIAVVLLAILFGVAMRRAKKLSTPETLPAVQTVERGISGIFSIMTQIMGMIIQIIPFAVFGVVAAVIAKNGLGVLQVLGVFMITILFGFFLHAVVYYSLVLWIVARKSPLWFFRQAFDAIVTAMSCGSSLATLPVTLRCLQENMKISPSSARLAACVGTNLNHDGIILYEAAATVFLAQAFGYELTMSQQGIIAISSLMAGIGIAGVPEAGLITLPLVLTAAGLPADLVAKVVPLILPVDWVIGRGRATTNVISDMVVANLLEHFDRNSPKHEEEMAPQTSPESANAAPVEVAIPTTAAH